MKTKKDLSGRKLDEVSAVRSFAKIVKQYSETLFMLMVAFKDHAGNVESFFTPSTEDGNALVPVNSLSLNTYPHALSAFKDRVDEIYVGLADLAELKVPADVKRDIDVIKHNVEFAYSRLLEQANIKQIGELAGDIQEKLDNIRNLSARLIGG